MRGFISLFDPSAPAAPELMLSYQPKLCNPCVVALTSESRQMPRPTGTTQTARPPMTDVMLLLTDASPTSSLMSCPNSASQLTRCTRGSANGRARGHRGDRHGWLSEKDGALACVERRRGGGRGREIVVHFFAQIVGRADTIMKTEKTRKQTYIRSSPCVG